MLHPSRRLPSLSDDSPFHDEEPAPWPLVGSCFSRNGATATAAAADTGPTSTRASRVTGNAATAVGHTHMRRAVRDMSGSLNAVTTPPEVTAEAALSKEGVVIVGGGPSGLATALMLAKRGWHDISVIERMPSADYYDKELAFVYQIDRRGQNFLNLFGLTEKLAQEAVDTRKFTLTKIPAQGERQELSLGVIDDSRPPGYWIPRNVFQRLLYREVEARYPDQIKVFYSATCESIEQVPEGSGLEVRARLDGKDGGETALHPRLVIGADGLKSTVRDYLRVWEDPEREKSKKSAKRRGPFDMRKQPSGASGLRYKVLTLPPRFRLGHSDDERARSEKAYAVLSKYTDSKRSVRIGVLPWGPPGGERELAPRGGNFITTPDHPLWDIKTADELKSYLADTFPQLPLADGIEDAELQRFAESKGGRFPDPQYCPTLQWVVGLDKSDAGISGKLRGTGGVALIGDAIHAFPPDLGQGVNAALEDVVVLERALESCGDRVAEALPEYERLRAADSKALIRLCQIGYPWQYRQPSLVRSKLWTLNFLLRTMFLNKLFPKVFGEQVFMKIQKGYGMSYSDILADTNRTTRRIWTAGAVLALLISCRGRVDITARSLAAGATSFVSRWF